MLEYASSAPGGIARECRHAFGHAVFYNVALRPFGTYGRSACHQFRPYTHSINGPELALMEAICDGAQTEALKNDCKEGMGDGTLGHANGGRRSICWCAIG